MERWSLPTMKSERNLTGNPLVVCGCGRRTNADMMFAVPAGLQQRLGAAYLCDACRERAHAAGTLDREELLRAQRAPLELVEKARARLATRP